MEVSPGLQQHRQTLVIVDTLTAWLWLFSLLEQRRQMKAQKRRKATQTCRNEDALNNVQELQKSELEVKYECCFLTRACARNPLSDVNVGPKIIFHTCCDGKARISTGWLSGQTS